MEYKVEVVREGMRISPRGEFIRTVIATWTVGDMGPFTTEMDKTAFTLEKMKAQVQAEADAIAGLKA